MIDLAALRERYSRWDEGSLWRLTTPTCTDVGGLLITTPVFESRASNFLLEEDRACRENLRFKYLVIMPPEPSPTQCIVIGHGFNEAGYTKLFPWACCLAETGNAPVIVFPLAFHMNRRGDMWRRGPLGAFKRRKAIVGNRCSSPFNAVESERISQNPERFFRGCCQSYQDLLDLILEIRGGKMALCGTQGPSVRLDEGCVIDFLGYSISGYVFLALLLMHGGDLLSHSRLVLFLCGASGKHMNPVSPLVIDSEAFLRGSDFYLGAGQKGASSDFLDNYMDSHLGQWFQRIFLEKERDAFRGAVDENRYRMMLVADPRDPIFPLWAIEENMGPLRPHTLELGIHEFPFNISWLDGMSARQIHASIRESFVPVEGLAEAFSRFVEIISGFLCKDDQIRTA